MHYFIAQIQLNDPEEYQKYIDKSDEVFKKYNGRYLAVDKNTEVLEGSWIYTRAVVIQFESKSDFEDWYYSDDYQSILKHRLKGAVCDTILVKGLD
jgi:uncharacterized protein (DUF1330 family)